MRYAVTWDEYALGEAARLMDLDPVGLESLFVRVDALGEDPRPAEAAAWGRDLARLRVGLYRVLYRIDDAARTVDVVRVGRAR